jgi:hypothetical protein
MLVFLAAILILVNVLIASWYNLKSPFWLDEIIVGSTACKSNYFDVLEAVRGDPSPPTHWVISHALFNVFGCELVSVRIVNAVLVAVGLFLLLRILYSKYGFDTALLFVTMFTGSFTVTYYSFEARMYALLMFSCLTMLGAVLLARWHIAVLFACFAASLHLFGWYLYVVLVAIYFLLYGAPTRGQRLTLGVGILVNVLFYGYTILPLASSVSGASSWFLKPGLLDLFYIPSFIFGGAAQYILYSLSALLIWINYKSHGFDHTELLILCCSLIIAFVLILFIVSQYNPMFAPRYAVFLAPVLFLGLSSWLGAWLSQSSSAREVKSSAVIGLVIVSSCCSVFDTINIGPHLRPLGWDVISYNSICASINCGFVLDDPIIPFTPDTAYHQISNFPVQYRNSRVEWEAVRPEKLDNWLDENPDKPFIYVRSSRPVVDIHELMAKKKLLCTREDRQPASYLCLSKNSRDPRNM